MQPTGRRSFLSALASLAGLTMVGATSASADVPDGSSNKWDLSWLKQLKGKHKQVFAVGNVKDNQPMHVAVNYLDAIQEVFGLRYPDVNAVIGIAGFGFPINANDALWAKYEIGRKWELKDPKTGEWATRNIFMDEMPAAPGKVVGVKPLVARGAIFWQCNNALGMVTRRFARETSQPAEKVREELLAGLHPHVHLVPAHTMALGLAQERGCTYEQIG